MNEHLGACRSAPQRVLARAVPKPPGLWRRGVRRITLLAVAGVGVAALTAACGGSPAASAGTTAYQKAVAYAQCMRAHGEPGYPDPTSNGDFLINGKKDHLVGGSVMAAADKACQHLQPPVRPLTAAQQRQWTSEALKYVACMRAHGLPGMQDPKAGSMQFSLSGTGVKPGSPVIQAAMQACRHLMPGLPGGGP
jgi:hypothetical protein